MVARFFTARKFRIPLLSLLSAGLLAACQVVPTANVGGGARVAPGAPVPVALLVPQSSSASGVAKSIENAARLAVADLQGVQIDLRVFDTGGTAAGAAAAATRAADGGAQIIVGPLFADAAAAAGAAVVSRGLNVLSFSNNTAVAGGNVFVLGNTFDNTATRLARYARSQGVRDIAIVHGQSPSEEIGRDAIARAVGSAGLRLTATSSFPLSQTAIVSGARKISQDVQSSGATGVFFTSGNDGALPFLVETLPGAGLSNQKFQYIGLRRADIPSSAISLPGLQGMWFAVPDPGLTAQFRNRYESRYGTPPHPLAGLGYDAVAAVGALARTGQGNALSGRALTRPSGFVGVGGSFRLRPNGTNQRNLAVAQIQNKQVVLVDAAPRTFSGPGF